MLRKALLAAKRRPLTSAIMMPIAEFSNAACHLSSLCWRASFFKDVWVFEDISRANDIWLSDGQQNRAHSAFFTSWGWPGGSTERKETKTSADSPTLLA